RFRLGFGERASVLALQRRPWHPHEPTDTDHRNPLSAVCVLIATSLLIGGGAPDAQNPSRLLDGEEVGDPLVGLVLVRHRHIVGYRHCTERPLLVQPKSCTLRRTSCA